MAVSRVTGTVLWGTQQVRTKRVLSGHVKSLGKADIYADATTIQYVLSAL
jgi:hypothetical protein